MEWKCDLGLQLYIAGVGSPDKQYADSQKTLKLIDENGVDGRIDVTRLDGLDGLTEHMEYFNLIKVSEKETRLPFLACAFGCETSAVLGYIGLEEITEILDSMGLLQKQ